MMSGQVKRSPHWLLPCPGNLQQKLQKYPSGWRLGCFNGLDKADQADPQDRFMVSYNNN